MKFMRKNWHRVRVVAFKIFGTLFFFIGFVLAMLFGFFILAWMAIFLFLINLISVIYSKGFRGAMWGICGFILTVIAGGYYFYE